RKDAIFTLEAAPLRADPRFMDFAAEIGLVDYWIEAGVWPDFCVTEDISYDCEETAHAARDKLHGKVETGAAN
ncbi:MAG: hypothetical protein HKN14_08335, partial [Marinicaulis sp.]|nr:hypothetical protein [Marinicaulis sp.]